LFDFDKAALRQDAAPVLAKLMDEVRARVPAGGRFTVEGHTDWIGSDAYNDRLSNKRAASVKTWLTKAGGVPGAQVVTIGYGERRPVAPNAKPDGSDDPDGRQKNRRVDILVRTR
jgi:outer membrane protein OmpA-like peptidoglycan-associated protein